MSDQVQTLLSRLDKVKKTGNSSWIACCPSHDDSSPSLAIKDSDGKILIHCFAGCETIDVIESVGLTFSDLMPEKYTKDQKPTKKPFKDSELIRFIAQETTIIYLTGVKLMKGEQIIDEELERFNLAVSKIREAQRYVTENY